MGYVSVPPVGELGTAEHLACERVNASMVKMCTPWWVTGVSWVNCETELPISSVLPYLPAIFLVEVQNSLLYYYW